MSDAAGSSANNGEAGIMQGISNSVTNAYNNAPDLGVTATLQAAYDKVPSMASAQQGASNAADSASSSLGINGSANAQEGKQEQSSTGQKGTDANGNSDDDELSKGMSLADISRERGPSSRDRIDKSQQDLGTEYGIPTQAGAGTTMSPDDKSKEAGKLEKSKGNQHEANVPEDYAPQPCPEDNAGTGKVDSIQRQASGHSNRGIHSRLSNNAQPTKEDKPSTDTGTQKTETHEEESAKDRDALDKVKDNLKGNLKVLKGRIARNEEKVEQGKAIKHGEA